MTAKVVLDISRLALRFNRPAPNGIDRVDLAFARHFLTESSDQPALLITAIGPRAVTAKAAATLVDTIATYWGEDHGDAIDPYLRRIREFVIEGRKHQQKPGLFSAVKARGISRGRFAQSVWRVVSKAPLIGRAGLFPGSPPETGVPHGATYINVSQFPFQMAFYWRWLERRPDVKPVFLIHDMLPVTHPEFFPPVEREQHTAGLTLVANLARAVVVTGETTKLAMQAFMSEHRLPQPPIEVIPLAVDPVFNGPPLIDPELASTPYFVTCGTLEPRKNHLLLLNIWREMARDLGGATPKLVIIGGRGWENENIIDMLDRCEILQPHIIEAAGLRTSGLKQVMDNARALLMPSFAEGFGLPVAEALAAGVPVVASDIGAFRTLADRRITRLDPLDGPGWMRRIRDDASAPAPTAAGRALTRQPGTTSGSFFSDVERLCHSI